MFAVGRRCPFHVVQGACALTLGGTFQWLVGERFSRRDAASIQTGRVDMAFRRVEFEGHPIVYSAIQVQTKPPLSGDSLVSYGEGVLEPLPSDPKISYLCT